MKMMMVKVKIKIIVIIIIIIIIITKSLVLHSWNFYCLKVLAMSALSVFCELVTDFIKIDFKDEVNAACI